MKKAKSVILIGFILFFVILVIFRNRIFLSKDVSCTISFNSDMMINYNLDDDYFVPTDQSSNLEYRWGGNLELNNIELVFEKGLPENANISLFNIANNGDINLIEQKTVRKELKKINFYFANTDCEGILISFNAENDNHLIKVPYGKIVLSHLKYSIIPHDVKTIIIIFVCLLISFIFSFLLGNHSNTNVLNARNGRESNLELLRIICMIVLIGHHYSVHGGLLNLDFSIPKYVGLVFLPVGKICFLAFIAISMFFLVDGSWKSERFINCYFEVLFYSLILTVIAFFMGGVIRLRDVLSCLFIMIGNSHGFAASYLLFLLLYPFIIKATRKCTKKQARLLLWILFCVQIISQILKAWTGYNQPVYSELTLFIMCYVLSLNLKRYPIKYLENPWLCGIIVIIVYLYVYFLYLNAYRGNLNEIGQLLCSITSDESSVFYIIGGYSLFYCFKNIKVPNCHMINQIASYTFGVLLIHDHNFFRHMFWNDVVRTQTFFNNGNFVTCFILAIIFIFISCATIDYLRVILFQKSIYKWLNHKTCGI